ncbi:MAG: cytochrome c oxidase subunit 4 [Acidimicrobiales bacterium]
MKTEAKLLIGVGSFFSITDIVYWFWGYHFLAGNDKVGPEQSGTVMLIGTVLLGFVPGLYYLWWSRHMKPRPEDRPDATIEEGSGVIGSFPSSSIWPFVFGMGCLGIALAAAFGFWLIVPAFSLIFGAAIGYTVESRRGGQV